MKDFRLLGITSQTSFEKIRKVVAKRTFEPHYLMLRSYYAVKFSSSSQVDFSRLVGSSARSLFSTASGFSHNLFGGTERFRFDGKADISTFMSFEVVGQMGTLGISRISDFLTRRTVVTLVLPVAYASELPQSPWLR